MPSARSPQQLEPIAAFVRELYELGGYATWKEFATDAGISAPQVSNFKNATAEPSGLNLFMLIQASTRRVEESAVQATQKALAASRPEPNSGVLDQLVAGQAEGMKTLEKILADLEGIRERLDEGPAAQPARKRR